MNDLLSNYLPIILFIGIAGVLGLALMQAPFIIAVKSPDPEKQDEIGRASCRERV